MYELLAELISETFLSEKNELDAPEDEPNSESTWLVNSTFEKTVNLGDICKLTPTTEKSKAVSNKKQTAFTNKITMNGMT